MPFIRRVGRPGLLGLAARTAVVAGTATAVSGAMVGGRQRRAQEEAQAEAYQAQQQQDAMNAAAAQAVQQQQAAAVPPPPAPAAPAGGGGDLVAELQKLGSLRDAGLLSDDEFAAAKSKLLGT